VEIKESSLYGVEQERFCVSFLTPLSRCERVSRIVELDKLISYIKSKPGVWRATTGDVARYLKNNNPNLRPLIERMKNVGIRREMGNSTDAFFYAARQRVPQSRWTTC
jgi:hypothetical protein